MPSLSISLVVAHIMATVLREFDWGVRQGILDQERLRAALRQTLIRLRINKGCCSLATRRPHSGQACCRGRLPRRWLPVCHRRQWEWTRMVTVNPIAGLEAGPSSLAPAHAPTPAPSPASALAPAPALIPELEPSPSTVPPSLGTFPLGYCPMHG